VRHRLGNDTLSERQYLPAERRGYGFSHCHKSTIRPGCGREGQTDPRFRNVLP